MQTWERMPWRKRLVPTDAEKAGHPHRVTDGSTNVSRSQTERVRRRGQGKQAARAQACPVWMTPGRSGPQRLSAFVWYLVPGWLGWVDSDLRGAWEPDKGESWGTWLWIAWLTYESGNWLSVRETVSPDHRGSRWKHVCVCVLSRVWLCDSMDYSPPGSSVRGIFQARILEWVAISFSTSWK